MARGLLKKLSTWKSSYETVRIGFPSVLKLYHEKLALRNHVVCCLFENYKREYKLSKNRLVSQWVKKLAE